MNQPKRRTEKKNRKEEPKRRAEKKNRKEEPKRRTEKKNRKEEPKRRTERRTEKKNRKEEPKRRAEKKNRKEEPKRRTEKKNWKEEMNKKNLFQDNGDYNNYIIVIIIKTLSWIIINYWTRSSKKYRDLSVDLPSTSANNWSARHWQIDISREPSSIIVLSFTYTASFYVFCVSFLQVSKTTHLPKVQQSGRYCMFTKIERNSHAQSIICSWATFLTNANAQTIICAQLFPGKLTNQNWEYYKVNDNEYYVEI